MDKSFKLEDYKEAFDYLENAGMMGKIAFTL